MVEAYPNSRVLGVPAMTWIGVEDRARSFMLKACPDCLRTPQPTPVAELFEGGLQHILGITYGVEDLHDAEAYFDPEANELILSEATYFGLLKDHGRDRFTVAHEFGHIVLHRPYYKAIRRDRRQAILLCRSEIKCFQDSERQSNVFASEFLIPTHHAKVLLSKGAEERDFMRIFHVSFKAAQVKMNRVMEQLHEERLF